MLLKGHNIYRKSLNLSMQMAPAKRPQTAAAAHNTAHKIGHQTPYQNTWTRKTFCDPNRKISNSNHWDNNSNCGTSVIEEQHNLVEHSNLSFGAYSGVVFDKAWTITILQFT